MWLQALSPVMVARAGSSKVPDDLWAPTSAHTGIGHSVPARASSYCRTLEIHPEVVHTDAMISITTRKKRRVECVKPLSVHPVSDLVHITTIHASSLDSDRGRSKMEVLLSDLAHKGYSPSP